MKFHGLSLQAVRGGLDHVLDEHAEIFRAIRAGEWKLVALAKGEWELYNLAVDRGESTNLATEDTVKVRELETMWTQHMAETVQLAMSARPKDVPSPAVQKAKRGKQD